MLALQKVRHNVCMVTRLNERPVRRSTLPLTTRDLADLASLRDPGPARETLGHLAPGGLPPGDLTESALLHAVFEVGLRAIRERAEELSYAADAASYEAEDAERRRIARRRPPSREDGED
jgi:signal transduction histidine kinase